MSQNILYRRIIRGETVRKPPSMSQDITQTVDDKKELSLHHVVHQPRFLVALVRSDWEIVVERKLLGARPSLLERLRGEKLLGECGWQPDNSSLIAHHLEKRTVLR